MTSIDDRIRGALSEDDKAFLASLDREPGMFRQIGDTFHGPIGRWMVLVTVGGLAITAVGVLAVVKMLEAGDTRSLILWTALAWAALSAVTAIKQWTFARMNTLSILRELKRIELRLADAGRR